MVNFINVMKNSNDSTLYLDADAISYITIDPSDKILAINTDEGQLGLINYITSNIDCEHFIKKISNANNMLDLPVIDKDKNIVMSRYVSAKAVTYMTISEVGIDGKMGLIMGVENYGRLESISVTKKELDVILKSIKNTGTKFKSFSPDKVQSRWFKPQKLYLDTNRISQIDGRPGVMRIEFKNSGDIDIRVNSKVEKDFIEKDLQKEFNDNAGFHTYDTNDERASHLRSIVDKYNKLKEDKQIEKNIDFMDSIATNTNLLRIADKESVLYVLKENISSMNIYGSSDKEIVISPKKSTFVPYPSPLMLRYDNKDEQEKAFKKFQKQLSKNKSKKIAKKPKPL